MLEMHNRGFSTIVSFALGYLLLAAFSTASAQTWDELHKAALKEGGTVNFYGTLAQINAERILPVFEKRFPASKSITSTPQRTNWPRERSRRRAAGGSCPMCFS